MAERSVTAMPSKLPPPKPKKRGMVLDSDEERDEQLVAIGELPEKIDDDEVVVENPKRLKKAETPKRLKPTALKMSAEKTKSVFADLDLVETGKKPRTKEKFVKTPKFDFMKKDKDPWKYEEEDEDDEEMDSFVQDDGDEHNVDLPTDFKTMSEKEAFDMWLEFVYLSEAQRPKYASWEKS